MELESLIRRAKRNYRPRRFAREVARYANHRMANIDRERWLHRVGLTSHTPVRNALGGIFIFILGTVAGSVLGLALAPKPGLQLRGEVKDRAVGLLNRLEQTVSAPASA